MVIVGMDILIIGPLAFIIQFAGDAGFPYIDIFRTAKSQGSSDDFRSVRGVCVIAVGVCVVQGGNADVGVFPFGAYLG